MILKNFLRLLTVKIAPKSTRRQLTNQNHTALSRECPEKESHYYSLMLLVEAI